MAKTTGTAARFIHPDATEEPVYRKFGIANIVEQIGIVRRAAAYHPDALVIEGMAVMPDLQVRALVPRGRPTSTTTSGWTGPSPDGAQERWTAPASSGWSSGSGWACRC